MSPDSPICSIRMDIRPHLPPGHPGTQCLGKACDRYKLGERCGGLSSSWTCRDRCAECCGPVPIPWKTYRKVKRHACVPIVKETTFAGYIVPMSQDCRCVFLDREALRCVIYKDRPLVCRFYGKTEKLPCPYVDVNGAPRTPEETERLKNEIKQDVNAILDKLLR